MVYNILVMSSSPPSKKAPAQSDQTIHDGEINDCDHGNHERKYSHELNTFEIDQ